LIYRDPNNHDDERRPRTDAQEQEPIQAEMNRGDAEEDRQGAAESLDDGAALELPPKLVEGREQEASLVRRTELG
jgi:hypothetical protein